MSAADQHLRVVSLLQLAIQSPGEEAAAKAVRADLEVLDRETLLSIATGLAVLPVKRVLPEGSALKLWRSLDEYRLRVMWTAGD